MPAAGFTVRDGSMKHPHNQENLRILLAMRALFFIHVAPTAGHLDQRKMSSSFECSYPIESVRILSTSVPVLLQWLPHHPPGMPNVADRKFPVIPFFTEVFSHNHKSQLVHIKVFRFLIIRNDDCHMMNRC